MSEETLTHTALAPPADQDLSDAAADLPTADLPTGDLRQAGYPDVAAATRHMTAALQALGFRFDRDGLARSPERVVRALDQLTWGRHHDPSRHLAVTFPAEGDAAVTESGIQVTALCEHHLLPFAGVVAVSLIPRPGARIPGLSKIARVAQELAARATVQERVTAEIADAIEKALDVEGVAVRMQATHACMSLRGACAHGAQTTTTVYRGVFLDPARQHGFRDEVEAAATAGTRW